MLGSNNYVTTYRFAAADTDGHTHYSSTATLTTEECYIERMSLSHAALVDAGNPYEVYEAVFDRLVDIKENDQVTDKNGKTYRVSVVERVEDFIEFNKVILIGLIVFPSMSPSISPSASPSASKSPSISPSASPSASKSPSLSPSLSPSIAP